MLDMIYRSIKISSETSEQTPEELCHQYGVSYKEYIEKAKELGEYIETSSEVIIDVVPEIETLPDIETEKPNLPTSTEAEKPKDNSPSLDEPDELRKDIDGMYESIIREAKSYLDSAYEITPKDLKEVTSVLQMIENIKYPNKGAQGLEIDMKNGIVRFLAMNSVDDL